MKLGEIGVDHGPVDYLNITVTLSIADLRVLDRTLSKVEPDNPTQRIAMERIRALRQALEILDPEFTS